MDAPADDARREELLQLYHRLGAVHVEPTRGFVVRGHRLSPFYVDSMRVGTSAEGLQLVTDLMLERLEPAEFHVVAAPSISGIPYASVLSRTLGKRLVIDRGTPSQYGFNRRLEGELRKGDRVVILDDIAKRGQTLIEVGEQVAERGGRVVGALVVVDAMREAERQRLRDSGIEVQSLISLTDLGPDPEMTMASSEQA
jgi:orotate phosphoribosyltransferase